MTTFVIVHGAWGGGWEWSPVADILRRHGHRAFTPTLTGMGERAHLSHGEPVGLGTLVDDIVAVLEFERLRDVVLCGASYGGMPATGAADRGPGYAPSDTGRCAGPRRLIRPFQVTGPSRESPGNRAVSCARAIEASSLASDAPRQ